MLQRLSKKIAIDLGSSRIRIIEVNQLESSVWELSSLEVKSKMLDEAACLVRRKRDKSVIAVGQEALAMRGRLDDSMELVFPIVASRIIDEGAAKALLRHLLKKVFNGLLFNPQVIVTTVAAATSVQQQVLTQLFYDLGFSKVNLIAAPLAAAIGAGVPIADSSGTLLLHMGASHIQFVSIALDSVLFSERTDLAGWRLDQEIVEHLALQDNLLISLEFAERLKHMVLSLANQADRATQKVMGKSITGRNPLELHVGSATLRPAAVFFQTELFAMMRSLLQQLPPELLQDVMGKGVLLTGGLAHIHGLEEALTNEFGMPVALLEESELLALMGASEMMRAGMV